jgi:hypothetical protein
VKLSCTTNALSDVVVPAIHEEKSALLGTQNTRPTTIEMTEEPAEDDGVLRRNRLSTLRAYPRLLLHPDSHEQVAASARCQQTRDIASDARLVWSRR